MSDKSKVYQGVRVKTTVKELLQRHRAREANSKNAKTIISQACLDLQELSASFYPTPPAPVPDVGCLQVPYPASFPVHETLCQTQDLNTFNSSFQHQFWDIVPPGVSGPSNKLHPNLHQHQTHLQHQDTGLPPSWNHGLSSDADYYGPGMVSSSPAESLKMCCPEDHGSFSSHHSFSSSSSTSSSSCYDSPRRLESSFCTPEPHPYPQHHLCQDSFDGGHWWTGQQASVPTYEYAPYYNSVDLEFTYNDESFYKRDLTAQIYNAL